MPADLLGWLVAIIGGLITVASAMVAGLRMYHIVGRYMRVPSDVFVLLGLAAGIICISQWFE